MLIKLSNFQKINVTYMVRYKVNIRLFHIFESIGFNNQIVILDHINIESYGVIILRDWVLRRLK